VRNALAERLADASNAPVASGDAPAALFGKSASGAAISKLVKIGVGIAFVMAGAFAVLRASESKNRTESNPATPAPIAAAKKPPEHTPELARPSENSAPAPSDEPASAAVPSTQNAPPERVAAKRTRAQGAAANPARTAERSQPKPTAAEPARERAASQATRAPVRTGESNAACTPRATGAAGLAGATDTGAPRGSSAAAESVATAAPVRAASEPTPSASASTNAANRTPAGPALAPREGPQPSAATTPSKIPPRPAAQAAADDEESADARAELAFVVRMNKAMQESKFRTVLTLCAEHERRWPKGTFVQEREGLRAIASCGSGTTGADGRARNFVAAYPRGPLAPRVREACASQHGPAVAKKSGLGGQADPK
jgi:hypothetical protein